MSGSWSNEETFKFIELYRAEALIWDPRHRLHKDRTMVKEGWQRIADALQIPVPELKKKKETLMAAFRMHQRKKQEMFQSGVEEVYKPLWIFYDAMDEFLKSVYEYKGIIANDGDDDTVYTPPPSRSESRVVAIEREEPNIEFVTSNKTTKEIKREFPAYEERTTSKPDLQNLDQMVASAFDTLNHALAAKEQTRTEPDECELYGRLLAQRLRKYSDTERQEIMYSIDGLLIKRRRQYNPIHVSSPPEILITKRSNSSLSNYDGSSPSSD